MDYKLIKAKKLKRGVLCEIIKDEKTESVKYLSIRAGLKWPTADSPAYYCILGEEWIKAEYQEDRRGKLIFMHEQEQEGFPLDRLFSMLLDDAAKFQFDRVIANFDIEYKSYCQAFWNYDNGHTVNPSLDMAPYTKDPLVGTSIIRKWRDSGKLKIPEDTIAFKQLKESTKSDLQDSFADRFWAVEALRFAVCAFELQPTQKPLGLGRDLSVSGPDDWMVA